MEAGRQAALADPDPDVVHLADVAMVALLSVLESAGALTEPKPAQEPPTAREAAILLCELSRSVRLSDPEEDHVQLLRSPAMVDYAWSQVRSGLSPQQTTDAQEARRVLIQFHRNR